MVLTVTLNPAIDKLLVLKKFEVHKLHRLESSEMSVVGAGGKGVNIAINLKLLGDEVIASGFAGGHPGHLLCDDLRSMGITTSFIFTEGLTRTNISILDQKNETLTEINDFGQDIPQDDLSFFLENYSHLLHRINFVVLAGSLPRGLPDGIYDEMIRMARELDKKVIIHTSPYHIDALLGISPFLINPDMRSNHKLLGKHCDGINQFINVGKEILIKNKDTEYVIFTHRLENVVAVTRHKSYILRPRNLKIVNMLGYADAYLAGFIHAFKQNISVTEILKFASSAGLSNVETLYKELREIETITMNLKRIEMEEIA
ncbi:Tagatose-6-phosphate kinase [subsurface metagenome]